MKPKTKADMIAEQVNRAKEHVLEHALLAFTEDIENKAPSDADIVNHGLWARFSKTPLTIFVKDGWEFHDFFIWRREHAVAIGFFDERDPIALSIVRVPRDRWPPALVAFVEQYPNPTTGTA